MQDLEQGIAAWRRGMERAGTCTAADIAELEQHVRESAGHLVGRGLAPAEALLVALHRIGEPGVLAAEYRKVNPGLLWAKRWYWLAGGFLGFSIVLDGVKALTFGAALLSFRFGMGAAAFAVAPVACYGLLCLGMLRSALAPAGRSARWLHSVAGDFERHPYLTALAGFTALLSLRLASGALAAGAFIQAESAGALDFMPWAAAFNVVAAVGVPVLLLLLSRHIGLARSRRTEPSSH